MRSFLMIHCIQRCLIGVPLLLASAFPTATRAQDATITESVQAFPTYPFSDPDPVARMGNIYPYFRFQGYSMTPVEQQWKIVTLENRRIRVLIAPEIGGKILGAVEKSTGKTFIYHNKVIKFREIAMRGPWTSVTDEVRGPRRVPILGQDNQRPTAPGESRLGTDHRDHIDRAGYGERAPRIGEVVLDVDDDERDTGAVAEHDTTLARPAPTITGPVQRRC